ncbi:unnamed protein product [Ixodes hexagonus]
MTLDELDDLLQDDWASLTPDQRQEYEARAKQPQGNKSSSSAPLRPVHSKVSSSRSDVHHKDVASTRTVVPLPFSMKLVREKLDNYCLLSQQPLNRETTFVIGRLPGAPKEGWSLVCHKGKLATLNVTCLREVALFKKLKQTYIVPAEELRPPLVVTASMLAHPASWHALAQLKQEKRDLSGFSYITDPLLTSNGFHLKLLPGNNGHPDQRAEIVRKASGVSISDLREILATISSRALNLATVEGTRPTSVLELLKEEAKRMSQHAVSNHSEQVKDNIGEFGKPCLHGNAICTTFFDMKDVVNM